MNEKNKYTRTMKGIDCDVYDVLEAFNVSCPALQHLLKKALNAGLRGHKDTLQDLKDIKDSADRAYDMELERQRLTDIKSIGFSLFRDTTTRGKIK